MPQHPAEETAPSHIFDKVAKESSDSTASDAPLHKENEQPVKQAASAQDHKGHGPQLSDSMHAHPPPQGHLHGITHTDGVTADLPEAKSKDELKAKAAEMNK